MNKEKSTITPVDEINYLGFDLETESVRLSADIIRDAGLALKVFKKDLTYRFLLQFLGIASWTSIIERSFP